MTEHSMSALDDGEEHIVSLRAEPRQPIPGYSYDDEPRDNDHPFAEFETKRGSGSVASSSRRADSSPLWSLAALAAIVVLAAQIARFETERLAQQAPLRPWLERLCPLLGCQVPEFRDLAHLQVIQRDLTPARGGIDGLEFRAVLANYADRPQPYPRLKLTLTQFNGESLARRLFAPAEYLPDYGADRKMSAGEVVEIHLTIANPGKDVGGFLFELL